MLLLFSTLPSFAQEEIANIPDYALRRSLAALLGKDPFAFPIEIKVSELKTLTSAFLSGYEVSNDDDDYYVNITDLTGLEHATELNSLVVSRREQVSSLEPIRGLTKLTNFSIPSNRITNAEPIVNLTNLTRLDLDNNLITDGSLTVISNHHNLTFLSLEGTGLENVGFISNLTNLTHLDIDQNRILDIFPLSNLTQLVELDLNDNQLSTVFPYLVRMTNLVSLDLDGNYIQSIEGITNLIRLESLDLMLNEIKAVEDLQQLSSLLYLNLAGNQITDVTELSNLVRLQTLDLKGNFIDLSWETANSNAVAAIRQRGATVETNPQLLTDPSHPFPDGILRALIYHHLGLEHGSALTGQQLSTLHSLSTTPLEYVHPRYLTNLTGIQLLTNLMGLDLFETAVRDLSPLTNSYQLNTLTVFGSEISDLTPLTSLTNLVAITVRNSSIANLTPLANLKQLVNINLEDNQIFDAAPLAGLKNLMWLDLDHNHISDVNPLSSLTNLLFLDLADNNVSNIGSLSNLTRMQSLDLDENSISDISALSEMHALYTLDLHDNLVLSLAAITNSPVRNLDVRGNYLNLLPGSPDTNFLSRIAGLNGVVRSEGQRGVELIYTQVATGLRVRWVDIPQFSYSLEQTSSLTNWESVSNASIFLNNGIWNADVPMNATAVFYRVRLSTK